MEGKLDKWINSAVLMRQPWALSQDDDSSKTVAQVIAEQSRRLGVSVRVKAFELLHV